MTRKEIDELSYKIIGAAIEVHKVLGPGLLESVYHKCLMKEFSERKLAFVSEINVPLIYKDLEFDTQLRCDFFVENSIAVEIKSVEAFAPVFEAQILSYMKLLNAPKGILINFNCTNIFKEGQKTYVNEIYRSLDET